MLKVEIRAEIVMRDGIKKSAVRSTLNRSFSRGIGSIMSLRGQRVYVQIPDTRTGIRRDAEAIRGDWERVGRRLVYAAHNTQMRQD